MINRLKPKSAFSRNVFTLMSGTIIAQAIPVLIMPVLTRLWSPEEFGIFAIYMALIAILGVVATGRLDMALLLARSNNDAIKLMIVSLSMACGFIVMLYLGILLFDHILKIDSITIEPFYYLVPLGTLLHAIYALMLAWHNRNSHYKLMSKSRIVQSGSISFSQVIVGLSYKFPLGLVFSDLMGRLISILLIIKGSGLEKRDIKVDFKKKIALLKRYKKFPLLEAPASLVNVTAQKLPFIMLPLIFSPVIAGLYFLVSRVLMMPASLIGTAVLEVFKNRVQEDFKRTGSCRKIFIRTGSVLFLIGLVPTVIIMIFAPDMFAFVFGENWRAAGNYAQILAPLALIQFISAPLSYVLVYRERLFLDLKLQLFFLLLILLSLWVTSDKLSMILGIWLLMISGVAFYLMQLIFSYVNTEQ